MMKSTVFFLMLNSFDINRKVIIRLSKGAVKGDEACWLKYSFVCFVRFENRCARVKIAHSGNPGRVARLTPTRSVYTTYILY